MYFLGTFLPFWGSAGDPSCCCSVLGHGDRLFCFLGSFYKLIPFLSDQTRYTRGGTVPETCTDQQDWSSGGARSPSELNLQSITDGRGRRSFPVLTRSLPISPSCQGSPGQARPIISEPHSGCVLCEFQANSQNKTEEALSWETLLENKGKQGSPLEGLTAASVLNFLSWKSGCSQDLASERSHHRSVSYETGKAGSSNSWKKFCSL